VSVHRAGHEGAFTPSTSRAAIRRDAFLGYNDPVNIDGSLTTF